MKQAGSEQAGVSGPGGRRGRDPRRAGRPGSTDPEARRGGKVDRLCGRDVVKTTSAELRLAGEAVGAGGPGAGPRRARRSGRVGARTSVAGVTPGTAVRPRRTSSRSSTPDRFCGWPGDRGAATSWRAGAGAVRGGTRGDIRMNCEPVRLPDRDARLAASSGSRRPRPYPGRPGCAG